MNYDQYTVSRSFYEIPIETEFVYKPVFSPAILYRKIKLTKKHGLYYNAVKVGSNQYESFDDYNTVRVIE
jgi:hypothetical protein